MNRQTTLARKQDDQRQWVHFDANGETLGRLATRIATVLRGKNKATFTPHCDVGDFVVVTNAEKVVVTGTKLDDKFHERYSGHPSGRKTITWREVLQKHPERLVETAVRRMLPKGPLGRAQYRKLKVYAGESHPHTAQNPRPAGTPAVATATA